MCRACDQDRSIATSNGIGFQGNGLGEAIALARLHYQKALTDSRYTGEDAMPADGVGDRISHLALQSPADIALVATFLDTVPNDDTTTATVTVGGTRFVSTINTPEDEDWIKVELQAGVTYDIGLYGTRTGPTGVPLRDPLVELYDSNDNFLRSDDSGGAHSQYSDNALLIFTPEVTGTYYINARAWDTSDPVGLGVDLNPATTRGDYVGDYEVFVEVSAYEPDYYNIRYETVDDPSTARDEVGLPTLDSSPLHSLDWQTRFDGSSRNPDGAEGPRPTGNEVETKIGGKNVIYYYFAQEGEIFVDNAADPLNLTTTMVAKGMAAWEKKAFDLALNEYEKVADVVYVEIQDRFAADIVVVTYVGTPGPFTPSVLGRMSPPDTASEGQTEFNAGDGRWNQQDLAPGGFFFGTLIHELGHGHGMSHPHDVGGGRASVMRGVEEDGTANYTLGDFDLNQSVYTMMSYMDGWQTSPYGMTSSTDGYGFIGSLMAFDIAVIQDKYGVNEEWATGNDTYVLRDENVTAQFDANGNITREATAYKSIWDGGGLDQIVYNGTRDATIDLRPATLKYEHGGGGWMSYANGIHGGFTIANAVTIENASGGGGNDTLIGNDVANKLHGNGGNDTIKGNGGNDTLDGGAGIDNLQGGTGNDTYWVDTGDTVTELADEGLDYVWARSSFVLAAGSHVEQLGTADWRLTTALNLTGNEFNNTITGNNGVNQLRGGGGNDRLKGLDGNDMLEGGTGTDTMDGGAGNDTFYVDTGDTVVEAVGGGLDYVWARNSFVLTAGAEVEILGTVDYRLTDALNLTGNEFNNSITGNNGANVITGGGGADNLKGLEGADVFRYVATSDSAGSAVDRILDFVSGTDKIDLSAIDAIAGTAANDAFTFIGNAAFSGVAGQLRAQTVGGQTHIFGDTNGDSIADLHIIVANTTTVVGGDFVV
jgi:serralysin